MSNKSCVTKETKSWFYVQSIIDISLIVWSDYKIQQVVEGRGSVWVATLTFSKDPLLWSSSRSSCADKYKSSSSSSLSSWCLVRTSAECRQDSGKITPLGNPSNCCVKTEVCINDKEIPLVLKSTQSKECFSSGFLSAWKVTLLGVWLLLLLLTSGSRAPLGLSRPGGFRLGMDWLRDRLETFRNILGDFGGRAGGRSSGGIRAGFLPFSNKGTESRGLSSLLEEKTFLRTGSVRAPGGGLPVSLPPGDNKLGPGLLWWLLWWLLW